jgi:glycosyltransferase involved in cell wall biosynthesis
MKEMKSITIVTRTHNRPMGFMRMLHSIKNQTYKNINHFVICDDHNDILSYVGKLVPMQYIIQVDREKLLQQPDIDNPNTGKLSAHNLYFNYFQENFLPSDTYVLYLDDDDFLFSPTIIEELVNEIEDEDTLLLFNMKLMGNIIPGIVDDNNKPRIGTIGSSCFLYNSKYKDKAVWDRYKCGDFRVIDSLFKSIPKYKFVDKVVVVSPVPGSGEGKDINQ